MPTDKELIQQIYAEFNARNIDAVLASLADDVAWANGMEGGHVHGRDSIRAYWTRQWATIDPHVYPLQITKADDGSTVVEVHQVVHDLEGKLLLDENVRHVFQIQGGRVTRFDIAKAGGLSSIGHA